MRGDIPTKPGGLGPAARFMQSVWEAIWGAGRLSDGPDIVVNRTTRGTSLILKRQAPAAAPTSSSLNYKGTYNPGLSYKNGDIVRVQTGSAQGVWVCVSPNGAGPGVLPVFPEPITTGGTNVWEMWAFGVQASVDCQNGNQIIYVNASIQIP